MKKLLSLLAATGLVATSGSVAVACNKKADDKGTATTKKDLSTITGDSLKLAPDANDEAAAKKAVISQIKAKLTVTVVETTDVAFSDFKAAESSDKPGSIVVTAAEKSTLVTGKATFALTFKAAEAAKPSIPDVNAQEVKIGETKSFDVTVENGDGSSVMTAAVKSGETFLEDIKVATDSSNKNKFTVSYKGKSKSDSATIVLTYKDVTKNVTVKVSEAEVAKTPVLSFSEAPSNPVDLSDKQPKTFTVKVENPVTSRKITVDLGTAEASLTLGEIGGTDAAQTFTLTAKAKIEQAVVITVKYEGATSNLTFNVSAATYQ
ncbi:hypothetical protein SHELI_v1c10130 [Spiroplasma helicoides]|uniref:Spiralin-like protein n=1 Tax=Spiroplasma helicoides TaxID=216938 RepID=A0A1B3SM23_9MOLU|nr:lipoprotein [Spiroplasma helicoides]AOG60960.1 hypothetical protein SHELI_v1c10130 [Spiroplasma helicoides]